MAISDKGKQTHGDHGYVFYQKPVRPRRYPIVFLHGIYQSTSTWETTPDRRDGFQSIFLREGFATYNMTHPRRGNAGRATVQGNICPFFDEESWYAKWRIGIYPERFNATQFPQGKESLNQFFRQITPDTAPLDFEVNTNAIAALFDKVGDAILVAHSQGVMHTWKTVGKTEHIKAIVGLEGGGFFSFPDNEESPDTEAQEGIEYIRIPPKEFRKFTRIPILLIYGDNIPESPSSIPELDIWRIRLRLAYQWAAAVNKRGGNVTIVHLPKTGIHGNTHFLMQDMNNEVIARLIFDWLAKQGLGSRS